ncbi:T7SS effector LXG polymorphic toxin [Terrilactibacillus sp. S3-3]|nr:T7SS effector LXG polymorphic toxin [Terrilactibacillus sp. S3-3]
MGDTTVFEAQTLIAAVKARAKQYEALKDQFQHLKTAFQNITDLDDFQGKGAQAIKEFYQAQIDVINAWLRLIDRQIAFFNGVPGAIEDKGLSGDKDSSGDMDTVVAVPFLEQELANGYRRSKDIVYDQRETIDDILSSISDLVSLDPFSTEAVDEELDKADLKRAQTAEAVRELDQALVQEYSGSESDEQYVAALFAELIGATRQGGDISPIHFDAEAYHDSAVYQSQGERERETAAYLKYKEQQEKDRELEKKEEVRANRPWYEKEWEAAFTFTAEVSGYNDYIRATRGVDPVTGQRLTAAPRVTAGAMAAAGFIPFIGWVGWAVKGGRAIYKTARGLSAADHALAAYQTPKALSVLEQSDKGLYGLVAANGMGEAFTGKDMFGHPVSAEEQRQSFVQAMTAMVGLKGMGRTTGEEGNLSRAAKEPDAAPFKEQVGDSIGKFWSAYTKDPLDQVAFAGASAGSGRVVEQVRPPPAEKGQTMAKAEKVDSGAGIKDNVGEGASETVTKIDDVKIPENMKKWDYPPSEELYKKYEDVYKNPKYYDQKTGEIHWPPNDGFEGEAKPRTTEIGEVFDRYGEPSGKFLAIEGTPYEQRALAPHSETANYYKYRVEKPFEIKTGEIKSWFGQPGGGTQLYAIDSKGTKIKVEQLIKKGYLTLIE